LLAGHNLPDGVALLDCYNHQSSAQIIHLLIYACSHLHASRR
jgi:hypothetical protein